MWNEAIDGAMNKLMRMGEVWSRGEATDNKKKTSNEYTRKIAMHSHGMNAKRKSYTRNRSYTVFNAPICYVVYSNKYKFGET